MRSRPARRATSAFVAALSIPAALLAAPVAAGPPVSDEMQVNKFDIGDQRSASVGMSASGDYVVVWDDDGFAVRAQRYSGGGVPQGGQDYVTSAPPGDGARPDVAVEPDGDYVVTWRQESSNEILARRYEADGTPVGGQIVVSNFPTGTPSDPAIAVSARGAFVITWTSNGQDGGGTSINALRFRATGFQAGNPKRVNTTTTGDQKESAVAMDAEGNYLVAWTSVGQDGSGDGVYLQRYDRAGRRVGTETRANQVVEGNQLQPAVGMDADGTAVVTWASENVDGDSYGIVGQFYADDSTPLTGGPINTTTNGNQSQPSVSLDADGDGVVTWASEGHDDSGYGIYGQRFSGLAFDGTDALVNETTTGDQLSSAVAVDADGDAVVAWEGPGSGALDVFSRRLRGPRDVDLGLIQAETTDPVRPGARIVYRVEVGNLEPGLIFTGVPAIDRGLDAASGVIVVSTVPAGAAFESYGGTGWRCRPAAARVTCKLAPALLPGTTADLTLRYTAPDAVGPVVHTARADLNQVDPAPANNKETEQTDIAVPTRSR